MFAIVVDRDGERLARYTLTDHDSLNPDEYAARYAAEIGYDIEALDPSVFSDGIESFRVYITDRDVPGCVVCWSRRNYMIRG